MRCTTRRGRTSTRCSSSFELEGALDAAVLQAAAGRRWCERHASLRAAFRHEGLEPAGAGGACAGRGAVAADRPVGLDGGGAAAAARRSFLAADRAERFDLTAPPLLRFALIRLAADRHRLRAQQPSPPDGRLVGADPGARAAARLCARAATRRRAAAGDAVPRLSGAGSRGRTATAALAAWRRGAGGARGGRRGWRRAARGSGRAVAPEQIALSR